MKAQKRKEIPLHVIMIVLVLACVIPFVILISSSFTAEDDLNRYGYSIFPRHFSTAAYGYIFSGAAGRIVHAYGISILVTVVGTVLSLLMTSLFAYPLSRPDLPGRGLFMIFLFIPMLFSGGLVPAYMMWTQMFHIKNTLFALLLPNLLMSPFFIIIMRSSFVSNISRSLIEAAQIDGATETRIFAQIVIPLSKPILATVGFMTALGYWNDWMNGLYYVTNTDYFGIQNILNRMLTDAQFLSSSEGAKFTQMSDISIPSVGIRMAVAVIGMIPILLAFPFFQKYLVKGISLGGVKG